MAGIAGVNAEIDGSETVVTVSVDPSVDRYGIAAVLDSFTIPWRLDIAP